MQGAVGGRLKINHFALNTDEHALFTSGSKEVIDILLQNGANVQHIAKDGYNALIYAVKHGELQ